MSKKMKITIYELLGLIKEGKAPKIKYDNHNWKYNTKDKWLDDIDRNDWCKRHFDFCELNDEVEIIEEEKEIEFNNFSSYTCNVGRVDESNIEEYIHILFNQQTRLIENQKKIIDVINDMRDKEC